MQFCLDNKVKREIGKEARLLPVFEVERGQTNSDWFFGSFNATITE